MVSRETKVQAVVLFLAFNAFAALTVGIGFRYGSAVYVVLSALFTFAAFGGAHLYFAVRGEGEGVSVTSSWRTVGLVGAFVVLQILASVLVNLTRLSGRVITVVVAVPFLLILAAYWYREAREGYRESRAQGET